MFELSVKLDEGYQQTLARLEKVEGDLRNKALNAGLRQSAKPLILAMGHTVPVMTGALKRSIGYRQLSRNEVRRAGLWTSTLYGKAIIVGPVKKVADYGYQRFKGKTIYQINGAFKALWLEKGTDPHVIRPRKKRKKITRRQGAAWSMLKISAPGGRATFVREVKHPGIIARRWMLRAQQRVAGQIPNELLKGLVRYLDRHNA